MSNALRVGGFIVDIGDVIYIAGSDIYNSPVQSEATRWVMK